MGLREIIIVSAVACSIFPFISTFPFDVQPSEFSIEQDLSRNPRQLDFITSPFRRVANSTRNIIKFIREYSSARLANGTTPAPQTTIGKRVVPLLQHVTIGNIRNTVNTLVNSEAAPYVADFLHHLDRDTLQLFNSAHRTSPPLLIPPRKPKPTSNSTTPATGGSKSKNSTITTTVKPGQGGKVSETTVASVPSSTKNPAPFGEVSNSNSENIQVKAVDNEEDETDSSEDD